MRLFFKDKKACQLTAHRKIFWALLFLFPLIAACTSLNEQLADSASLAQVQKNEQEEEAHNRQNGGKSAKGEENADRYTSNNASPNNTSSIPTSDVSVTTAISDGTNAKNDKPKTLLSMFSGKKNNEIETGQAPVDAANSKSQNDSNPSQAVANPENNNPPKNANTQENANNSETSQPKSLFSMFSNKKDTNSAESSARPAANSANQTTNQTAENNIVTNKNIMAARSGGQDQGARMRLFSGDSDDSISSDDASANRLAALRPEKVDRSQYSGELPGVRPNGGIEIKHRTSLYDDTDIDANEVEAFPSIQLASVGGLGRNLPNGLRPAHKAVDVRCLKPQLIGLLKAVERKFNQPVYITSGYRNPIYNRKVNGANRSLHMSCAAADIIVLGVHKYEVANFVRSLPGRGGVGTYCNQAIHVDIGTRRDWNWSCSGKN